MSKSRGLLRTVYNTGRQFDGEVRSHSCFANRHRVFRRLVRRSLPRRFVNDDAVVDRVALRLQRGLFASFLPAVTSKNLTAVTFAQESDAQQERDERRLLRKLAQTALGPELIGPTAKTEAEDFAVALANPLTKSDAATESGADSIFSGTNITFQLATPGRVLATNGTLDAAKRNVEWNLPPECAALQDVTLTAVCTTDTDARYSPASGAAVVRAGERHLAPRPTIANVTPTQR